jgi:hypothetical protein
MRARESAESQDAVSSVDETTEIRSLSGEDVTAAPFVSEIDRGEAVVRADEDATETERRRGRSRRRRRGRGRRSDRRQEEERAAVGESERVAFTEDESHEDDEFGELGVEDEELSVQATHADTDVNGAADESENGQTLSGRSKAAQRAIPSWEEAIGFIVDSNMQNRSQRRPSSRGESRGRSRGRRKN